MSHAGSISKPPRIHSGSAYKVRAESASTPLRLRRCPAPEPRRLRQQATQDPPRIRPGSAADPRRISGRALATHPKPDPTGSFPDPSLKGGQGTGIPMHRYNTHNRIQPDPSRIPPQSMTIVGTFRAGWIRTLSSIKILIKSQGTSAGNLWGGHQPEVLEF